MRNRLVITAYIDMEGVSDADLATMKEELKNFGYDMQPMDESLFSVHVLMVGINVQFEQTRIEYDYIKL